MYYVAYIVKCILFCNGNSSHYFSLKFHMIFQKWFVMLIWCFLNIINGETAVLLSIFVETVMDLFSAFTDEYKVQKDSICFK